MGNLSQFEKDELSNSLPPAFNSITGVDCHANPITELFETISCNIINFSLKT